MWVMFLSLEYLKFCVIYNLQVQYSVTTYLSSIPNKF